ncbi:hypothetical protein [Aureispira sp. CCB-E]|uniref:hypothetical protein n=1 Tax=Aureispira sp. CCB-E TaxID=3051121 RepID=UPI0028690B17|nr:hypothetical protein [Aureispira sp. CCB-E]WMX17068.1 hypothetical protein QP953_11860 [Aureispira sp. CCB-E]
MKLSKSIIFILILCCSCNSDKFEVGDDPIIYLGIDTTYDHQPTEAYCVHTSKLSIISEDSIILYLGHSPTAPVDSPYGLHGTAMIYQGVVKKVTKNDIVKVEWNFDPSEDIVCDEEFTNQMLIKKDKVTLIDLTKDTLCIGNIECIKQQ